MKQVSFNMNCTRLGIDLIARAFFCMFVCPEGSFVFLEKCGDYLNSDSDLKSVAKQLTYHLY